MEQDWAGVPKHLLDLIFWKLSSFTDYVQFGAVCLSWDSILKDNVRAKQNKLLRQHQVPSLLFPDEEEDQWTICNVMNNKFLELKLSLSYKRRFSGSSEGWLVTVNENHTITLHRPDFIAKDHENNQIDISIDLPCIIPPLEVENPDQKAYDYHVLKALITADALENPDNCTIAVIFGDDCEIAFIRCNKDNKWINITNHKHFDDIVHYNNKIYALGFQGELISLDTTNHPPSVNCIAPDFPGFACNKRYLVESCGELLQVERVISLVGDMDRSTTMFKIYRMDFEEGRWVEIESLGGAALFVGDNSSISVLAYDFNGCQPNCIYFTHDDVGIYLSKGSDLGIYNVETGSFELHYNIDPTTFSRMVDRPPIWVVPIPKV